MKFVGLDRLLHHLFLLEKRYWSEIWVFVGRKGKGKTSSLRGLLGILQQNGYSWTSVPGEDAKILFLDDLAQYFYKRDFMRRENKEFMKFLRLMRGVYLLIVGTVQKLEDLDKDFREDSDVLVCEVASPGIFIIPVLGSIMLTPKFVDDKEMRLKQLKRYQEALKASQLKV